MKLLLLLVSTYISLLSSDAFIKAEDLSDKLSNSNLVILDVTDKKEYEKEHIIGAIRVDMSKIRKTKDRARVMVSNSEIQKLFRQLGINNESEIVIYSHGKKKEILKSSYLALACIINGIKDVSILNGGYPDWVYKFEELTTNRIPDIKKGNFSIKHKDNVLVDINYVKNNIGKVVMLDARPTKYYYGTHLSPGIDRAGHIPMAMSSFWGDKFMGISIKSKEDIEAIFLDGYELNKKDEVLLYCTGGLETSMNWYVLYQYLGFKPFCVIK